MTNPSDVTPVTSFDGTSQPYRKPMPVIDVWNRRFWEATCQGVFLAQRDEDGNFWFPPAPVSPFNQSERWEWVPLSGRGTVVSWVIFHQKYFSGFADSAMPYNVVALKLDEGPLIYSNLVDLGGRPIACGLRVALQFQEMDGRYRLPVFAPEPTP